MAQTEGDRIRDLLLKLTDAEVAKLYKWIMAEARKRNIWMVTRQSRMPKTRRR